MQKAFAQYVAENGWKNNPELLPPLNPAVPEDSRKDSFLLDFVVWRRDLFGDKEGAWIACESEWNVDKGSAIEDFQKLLSFRAPYKVMIYDIRGSKERGYKNRTEFGKLIDTFAWSIDREIYIFLEFVATNRIASIYTCEPNSGEGLVLAPESTQ